MSTLIHLAQLLSAAWAAAGELITAGAILWSLNSLANLVRFTYKAGRLTGRLLWPVIHATVAGLRWAARNIDWRLVATIVFEGLVAIGVALWMAAVWSHRNLIALSARLGRCYAALLTTPETVVAVTVLPMVHPLAEMAADLETMTCKQLRELIGTKKRLRKAELIALAVA